MTWFQTKSLLSPGGRCTMLPMLGSGDRRCVSLRLRTQLRPASRSESANSVMSEGLPTYSPALPPRSTPPAVPQRTTSAVGRAAAPPQPASPATLVAPQAPPVPRYPAPDAPRSSGLRTGPSWRVPKPPATPAPQPVGNAAISPSFDYNAPAQQTFSLKDLPTPIGRPLNAVLSIPNAFLQPIVTQGQSLYLSHLRRRGVGEVAREQGLAPYFPVLIVPGFMSSGLKIVESTMRPDWVGERAWLSIQKLGFGGVAARNEEVLREFNQRAPSPSASTPTSSLAPPSPIRTSTPSTATPPNLPRRPSSASTSSASVADDDDDEPPSYDDIDAASVANLGPAAAGESQTQRAWLAHVTLGHDAREDPQHCMVRPLAGLEGVDFLQPGALLELGTYVFGPLIKQLVDVGYRPGFNLEAAPYDWRLCPPDLEDRDGYFSRLARTVERLCATGNNVPVVLLAHSMGCRIAHYFSEWAHERLGDAWCARFIHSVVAVGGPWLGAQKSGRGSVTGDSMGVPFLKPDECIWYSRRLGSPPLLFPVGPRFWSFLAPAFASARPPAQEDVTFCFVKQESYLVLTVCSVAVAPTAYTASADGRTPHYIQLEWRGRKVRSESNPFFSLAARTLEWTSPQRFQLPTEHPGKLVAGHPSSILKISLMLDVPGLDPVVALAELDLGARFASSAGAAGAGEDLRLLEEWDGVPLLARDLPAPSAHLSATVSLRTSMPAAAPVPGWNPSRPGEAYAPAAVREMLLEDGAMALLNLWEGVYAEDPRAARSLQGLPPRGIKAWHIVYSTGRRTEVGFCVRRRFCRVTKGPDGGPWNQFKLDKGPRTVPGTNGKLVCENGIVYETPATPQPSLDPTKPAATSGDGTVPYISLIHPFTWRAADPSMAVSSHLVPGAEHRAILADEGFQRHVLDYVCARPKKGLREVKPISTREKVERWFK
ncbi:Lecithin:cholesterol acyltransferase-domain-containing protein [Hyaloraphidium curvatum]|nr:Lecithin:cholesterol acyltransferase-domain-containing protein [Hyaloraphidium curvatum]